MAAAFVACTKLQNPSGASVGGSVSATASNALFAMSGAYFFGATSTPTYTVSGGGTWTTDGRDNQHYASNDDECQAFASCPVATGGTNTVTVTWGSPVVQFTAYVYEFSGMATSSILDVSPTGKQGSISPLSTNAMTNVTANAVFMAVASTLSSASTEVFASTGSGWAATPTGGSEGSSAQLTGTTGYAIVSTIASRTESWTDDHDFPWANYIICYKQAGPAAFVVPHMTAGMQADVGTSI